MVERDEADVTISDILRVVYIHVPTMISPAIIYAKNVTSPAIPGKDKPVTMTSPVSRLDGHPVGSFM